MWRQTFLRISVGSLLMASWLGGVLLSPRPAPAQAQNGGDLYRSQCDGCHELYDPESPRRGRKEWDEILTRMVKVRGAVLNDREFRIILDYLDSFNRPSREIRWVDAPARSREAAFLEKDAGNLPSEWVDLTLGSDAPIPWAVQVDSSTKSAYVAPLQAAGEGQFPALLDNTGLFHGGRISARFRLQGGGAPGAGVLFGYRNPQSYFGVRVSSRDVVLYEVKGGARALLGRAAVAAPLKTWHALDVELTERNVRVSFNGKPLPTLSRTLTGYHGGRVGLHTQGDTTAWFDQWKLAVQ